MFQIKVTDFNRGILVHHAIDIMWNTTIERDEFDLIT
jgi:hypothetical protein